MITSDFELGLIHRDQHPLLPRLSAMAKLPEPKPEVNWHDKVPSWPMLANDRYGTCVPAGMLHAAQLRMANAWGSEWQPWDDLSLGIYKKWNPAFDPNDASTDRGTYVDTAMTQWTQNGIDLGLQGPDCGWHLGIDPLNTAELKLGIDWFGASLISLNLPASVDAQSEAGLPWVIGRGADALPGSKGAHFVIAGRYDQSGIYCITWGGEQPMSLAFYLQYVMRVDLPVSASWLDATGISPPGFSRDQLAEKMAALSA